MIEVNSTVRRLKQIDGYYDWCIKISPEIIPANEIALIICDVWNTSCFLSARDGVEKRLFKIDQLARYMREKGSIIIHKPTVHGFYRDSEVLQRTNKIQRTVRAKKYVIDSIPPLPIDDSDNLKLVPGLDCSTGETKQSVTFDRQHDKIYIDHSVDFMTNSYDILYSIMEQRKIKYIFILGFHLNKCILFSGISIVQLVRQGVNVRLIRDLTDVAYNPKKPPYVNNETALQLMVEYIEKFWCPTISSKEILI